MISCSQLFVAIFVVSWVSTMAKIDEHEETELWKKIGSMRKQICVPVHDNVHINKPEEGKQYLKVVAISDTHEQLQNIKDLPDGDVLIHAGDFTNNGNANQIRLFNDAMRLLPHKHKLVIAGNHELGFDKDERLDERSANDTGKGTDRGYELLTDVTYLHEKNVTIDGIKFFGASYHPLFGFPFYRTRASGLAVAWRSIPNDTDVLITHTPPLGYMDVFTTNSNTKERWGCRDLLYKVEEVKPKYHIFGHVHDGYGVMTNGDTVFINAAQCERNNTLRPRPLVFYIEKKANLHE